MNHVERHLDWIPTGGRLPCYHPICQSERLILANVDIFKNYIEIVHRIILRKPNFIQY
jgi:hypothetical protein